VSAKLAADLLGDKAFLIEQLGFGHTSLAQVSSCTSSVMYSYLANNTVRAFSLSDPSVDTNWFVFLASRGKLHSVLDR